MPRIMDAGGLTTSYMTWSNQEHAMSQASKKKKPALSKATGRHSLRKRLEVPWSC